MTCYPSRATILPNFITLRQPIRRRYPLQKNYWTNKETDDISPACISACGDNKRQIFRCLCTNMTVSKHSADCKIRSFYTIGGGCFCSELDKRPVPSAFKASSIQLPHTQLRDVRYLHRSLQKSCEYQGR